MQKLLRLQFTQLALAGGTRCSLPEKIFGVLGQQSGRRAVRGGAAVFRRGDGGHATRDLGGGAAALARVAAEHNHVRIAARSEPGARLGGHGNFAAYWRGFWWPWERTLGPCRVWSTECAPLPPA